MKLHCAGYLTYVSFDTNMIIFYWWFTGRGGGKKIIIFTVRII